VYLKWQVFGGNPLQRSGSGSEPDPEPNREFEPIANTTHMDFASFVYRDSPRYGLATERRESGKCCMGTCIVSLSTI
jgi:hypothetical protein